MDFYVGAIGLVIATTTLEEAQKVALPLEERAIEGICWAFFRHYSWPEFNPEREQGVLFSIIGRLYSPDEYRNHRIAKLHHDIVFMSLKNNGNAVLPEPPEPLVVDRVSPTGVAMVRVLPIFAYGDEKQVVKLIQQRIPGDVVCQIVLGNLGFDPSITEVSVYNETIDFHQVWEWYERVVRQLQGVQH